MIGRIVLKEMRFYAFHGVGWQENVVGNHFVVSLTLSAPLSEAIESDELGDTIDYSVVYRLVKKEMDISSRLIEHVGGRILRAVKAHYPCITEIELSLSKLNPPVGGDIHSACVVLKETYEA
ncbi:MAG: dihydroneopterin aldolase [Tannerellaceae bacterium]|jgi:dihydroneopterin aldolase|nr:dihydroneopterin aldolase [Tannerellaceae bacterium]